MVLPMSARANTSTEDRSYKLNRLFFRRVYDLSAPYWFRKAAWKAWVIMAILLTSATVLGFVGGYISNLVAASTNALLAKQHIYWRIMIWMTFVGLMQTGAGLITGYLSSFLLMDWRRWMTRWLLNYYLRHRTYYEIEKEKFIDNPDQRIQEEVSNVCQTVIGIPQFILSSLTTIGVQAAIIIKISPSMFWAVLAYSVLNTLVALWVNNPTIRQNWDLTRTNANFRSSLMHLKDNAETIAFYRGEQSERVRLLQRLADVAKVKMTMLYYSLRMSVVNQFMSLLFSLLPIFFVVPLYFSSKISYGLIDQSGAAATMVLSGLSVIANFIPTLTSAMPSVIRLAEIKERSEQLGLQPEEGSGRIRYHHGDEIALDQVDMYTPGREIKLLNQLSLRIPIGCNTIITGRTGCGKSSLLRLIAGIWHTGDGAITLPERTRLMFIPQRPYMVLSDLRSQILYPQQQHSDSDDQQIYAAFARLGMKDFPEKHGGLDKVTDWRKVLSLGEQQIIAFVRVLLRCPDYVFLDEATSALDVNSEKRVYRLLKEAGITAISVGHRETLLAYHQQQLHLQGEGLWVCGLPGKGLSAEQPATRSAHSKNRSSVAAVS